MATLNDFNYVDDSDDVMAVHVNNLLAASLRSEYKNVESLSATRTLLDVDTPIQRFDCNGANRIVKMPTADTVENHPYLIVNSTASGTYTLTIQNNGGTITHAVLNPSEFIFMLPDGDGTYLVFGKPFNSVLTPAQITSNQDNYNPTGAGAADVLRISSDAARNITGFGFPAQNKTIVVTNVGSYTITLTNDATSTAENRFLLGADFGLEANKSVVFIYDPTSSRWRMVGGGSSAWGGITGTLASQSDLDKALNHPDGTMKNGKIEVTVVTNDITLALKTLAGTDPSASDPVHVWIKGVKRTVTAALSVTLTDGTQWFGLGTPFAALEQQFFPYLGWRAASSAVVIGFGRIPYATVFDGTGVTGFSTTTTNEKYGAFSTAPASTDDVVVIGRFSATLSAGASYNWSVPTFTSTNLIQHPIYETDWMNWLAAPTGYSSVPTNVVYQYRFVGKGFECQIREGANGTSNATSLTMTAPFTALTLTNMVWQGYGSGADNSAGLTTMVIASVVSAGATFTFSKDPAGGAWTASGGKRVGVWRAWCQVTP